jgi:hypothetical protein
MHDEPLTFPLSDTRKPLFVPLRTEFFEQFKNRTKSTEYRLYGSRWNERHCSPGRRVTLSHGYGKHARLYGQINGFSRYPASIIPTADQKDVLSVFGRLDVELACIEIELDD